jgi:uncharacterized Fe-S center protein
MKKVVLSIVALLAIICLANAQTTPQTRPAKSKVYFMENISPENLVKIYQALGRKATGRVGVKISTGEQGGNYYLHPELIKNLVDAVHGTIVECNTNYGGSRMKTADHEQTIENHGFNKIAKVDIMDANGEVSIPTPAGSKYLKEDLVGKDLLNYDFLIVLNHFKGHAMGGFGGALKNLSIGCASSGGKGLIHTAGKNKFPDWSKMMDSSLFAGIDEFKDCMAESAGAVINHFGKRILYISVMNNLSVDCDCDSHPAEPKMKNVGIMASLDPIALDQACVDMVFNSNDSGNRDLVERIVSRHGTRILYWGQHLNLGSRDYELVHVK